MCPPHVGIFVQLTMLWRRTQTNPCSGARMQYQTCTQTNLCSGTRRRRHVSCRYSVRCGLNYLRKHHDDDQYYLCWGLSLLRQHFLATLEVPLWWCNPWSNVFRNFVYYPLFICLSNGAIMYNLYEATIAEDNDMEHGEVSESTFIQKSRLALLIIYRL